LITCAVALLAPVLFAPLCAVDADTGNDRMAQLEARLIAMEARLVAAEQVQPAASNVSEARIAELESRLAEAEQETREVKALAATGGNIPSSSILGRGATFDIMANSAWRKLRWTQPEQWEAVRPGASADVVIDALGKPPRSVKSLKPRVDEVFFLRNQSR
jgi:multidrug resistance efflux pump